MANKLSSLIRKIFLSSMAGIVSSNSGIASNNELMHNPNDKLNEIKSEVKKRNDLNPKLILKKNSNNEWNFNAHRSHRSHSSHRSHYSSNSNSSSSSSRSSNQNSNYNSSLQQKNNNNNLYLNKSKSSSSNLGDRTLKRGMSGSDVTKLINILLTRGYLVTGDGATYVTGIYTYDKIIEDTIKKFQLDKGLTSDGVCGSTTIYYLKND